MLATYEQIFSLTILAISNIPTALDMNSFIKAAEWLAHEVHT